jgi:hypothetical protein
MEPAEYYLEEHAVLFAVDDSDKQASYHRGGRVASGPLKEMLRIVFETFEPQSLRQMSSMILFDSKPALTKLSSMRAIYERKV